MLRLFNRYLQFISYAPAEHKNLSIAFCSYVLSVVR